MHVRFGSKADMCSAKRHVRFTAIIGFQPHVCFKSHRPGRCGLQAAPVHCAMPTDADRTADYKGFTIRTFKTPNGSWRAIITKADGSKIKAPNQKESFDMIPVQLDSLDRNKALEETKRLIDAGGMT